MIWDKINANFVNGSEVMASGPEVEDVWVELESDPGLFTLLIQDFGVEEVQVEEIYDLESSLQNCNTVYGFIFLFKWVESGRRARGASLANSTTGTTVTDANVINSMFFAQQIVTNACATHALLSILLNCDEYIKLGPMLTAFKAQTFGMTPEAKGNAVGEAAPLAWAHNKHARPDVRRQTEREASTAESGRGKAVKRYRLKSQETFHFISYLPINGRLYELDGLKSYPVDHGEIPPGMQWTQYFQNVISERIGLANSIQESNEIRYNLMALIPSKRDQIRRSLDTLKLNRAILYDGLEKLLQATDPKLIEVARQKAKPSASKRNRNADDVRNLPSEDSRRFDQAALLGAARSLSRNPTDLTAPLTIVTSTGRETKLDFGISSGASDQSALNWPISTLEVVTVTKDESAAAEIDSKEDHSAGGVARTPSSTSPLSSLSDRDTVGCGSSTGALARASGESIAATTPTLTKVEPEESLGMNCSDISGDLEEQPSDAPKAALVVKLATTGSNGFGLFGPLGLATYVQRLEEKIAAVERHLNDEIASRVQWEVEDDRRTHDYDAFIKTFLTMMAQNGIAIPAETPPKNGKAARGRMVGKRGSTAGRKRRCPW